MEFWLEIPDANTKSIQKPQAKHLEGWKLISLTSVSYTNIYIPWLFCSEMHIQTIRTFSFSLALPSSSNTSSSSISSSYNAGSNGLRSMLKKFGIFTKYNSEPKENWEYGIVTSILVSSSSSSPCSGGTSSPSPTCSLSSGSGVFSTSFSR